MVTDRDLLELIASQVGILTTQVGGLTTKVDGLTTDMTEVKTELSNVKTTMATKQDLSEVKSEVNSIKAIVVKIENDYGQKLGALLNGYIQNAESLNKVEEKLAEHEEILLKRF